LLNYCCTTPLPSGDGNISTDPQLADSSHISASSPCIGAGEINDLSGTDVDGETWLNPPSIGCDEYHAGSVTGTLVVSVSASPIPVAAGFSLGLTGNVVGHASGNHWDFGDGMVADNTLCIHHEWDAGGEYGVVFTVFNETHSEGISASATVSVAENPVHYVDLNSLAPLEPYRSWGTAATNIQDAVDSAFYGGTVLVADGIYETGGRVVYGSMTNRVVIDRPITVKSVNGPDATVIKGAGSNGNGAVRCVYLGTNATLVGFALINGHTRALGSSQKERSGGGAWCESAAMVSNCTFSGNSASFFGGGMYQGTASHCTFIDNGATYGGGKCQGTANHCTFSGNSTDYNGGGMYQGTANYCTFNGNSATRSGGGMMSDGTANHCTFFCNSASLFGGGMRDATANNCTIIGNATSGYGGGMEKGRANNCIIWYNTAGYAGNNLENIIVSHSCSPEVTHGGDGNTTNAPLFVNFAEGDYHLRSNSPCINWGNNACVVGSVDLDANPRIVESHVDMGAYEYQGLLRLVDSDGDGLLDDWEWQWFGGNVLPEANPDDDVSPNEDEFVAGTDPTSETSYFAAANAVVEVDGTNYFMVEWISIPDRLYSVRWSTNLVDGFQTLEAGIEYPQSSYTDTTHNAETEGFYQVEVKQKTD